MKNLKILWMQKSCRKQRTQRAAFLNPPYVQTILRVFVRNLNRPCSEKKSNAQEGKITVSRSTLSYHLVDYLPLTITIISW